MLLCFQIMFKIIQILLHFLGLSEPHVTFKFTVDMILFTALRTFFNLSSIIVC